MTSEPENRLIVRAENLRMGFPNGPKVPKNHETQWVVEGLDFELRAGKCLGLVGESGSGKSLTALALLGLQPPQTVFGHESRLWYHENDKEPVNLLALPEKERRKYRGRCLAMVFQEPMTALNPVWTCGAQVAEALRIHENVRGKAARSRAESLFAEVQLPEPSRIFDSYPHQLSGGQKQRVLLSMALACSPEILVADEPTTALDVTVQFSLLELIGRLQAEKQLSLLFISHDLGVVRQLADQTAVLRHGKLVEMGQTSELFSHPKHPYTQGLVACRPRIDVQVKQLPTLSDFEQADYQAPEIVDLQAQVKRAHFLAQQPVLLSAQNLNVVYRTKKQWRKDAREVHAVQDVSFDLRKGESLGLVGESGSGKTTIGRAILRLVDLESGQVQFQGHDWLAYTGNTLRRKRRAIQLIFQDPYGSLNPKLTIGQTIMEPLLVHGMFKTRAERRKRAEELLEQVGLQPQHLDRYPDQFSGGQRQRICIARSLSVEPELIVCDESVSALDVSVQAVVLNLLQELQQRLGLSYLFITHDLRVVRFLCDRVVVLQNGRIVESGPVSEVLDSPKEAYTKKLVGSVLQ